MILKQDEVNNANSAFILINLLISWGCHSGLIGKGGPCGPVGPGGSGGQVVRGVLGGQGGQGGQDGQVRQVVRWSCARVAMWSGRLKCS